MDLSHKSAQNVEFMIEEIKKKLKVVSVNAIKAAHFDEEQYEDIKDIYEMINNKTKFSINEVEAIVRELGKLRKV
jgi:uncharacterized protein YfkK (UPF0435 family)